MTTTAVSKARVTTTCHQARSDDAAVRCEIKLTDSITLAISYRDWAAKTPAQRIKIVAEHIEAKIRDCGGVDGYLDHALDRIVPHAEKL